MARKGTLICADKMQLPALQPVLLPRLQAGRTRDCAGRAGRGPFHSGAVSEQSSRRGKCPLDVLVSNFPSTQISFQPHSAALEDSPVIGALMGLYAVF